MLAFIVSRLLQSLAVMLAVSFLCFVLFNFVGDPVNNMVGQEATPAERALAAVCRDRQPLVRTDVHAAAVFQHGVDQRVLDRGPIGSAGIAEHRQIHGGQIGDRRR